MLQYKKIEILFLINQVTVFVQTFNINFSIVVSIQIVEDQRFSAEDIIRCIDYLKDF